jgi:aminotransferase
MEYNNILRPQVRAIRPSGIRKFFDLAESISGVISLGVGEPDFATPWKIRAAGIEALDSGRTKYSANRGLLSLRRAVCDYLLKKGVGDYDPATEVLITVGGSEAIDMTLRAVVSPGDEVIIPQPSYVCYEPLTRLAGGVPVIIETQKEEGFRLTAKALAAALTPKTKALVLPYPCNPTGAIMEKEHLEELAALLRNRDILVVSDEIYAELTYGDKKHVSIASLPGMRERTVVINGFSKAFSMTGWRLGYAVGPKEIISAALKIHQYAVMCAPTLSQRAAVVALTECEDDVNFMLEEYDMRRRLMVNGFQKAGLPCQNPSGAFYAFPSICKTGLSSEEFCERLLLQERVAVVPGTAFGRGGEGFIRASYCYSVEHIKEALLRISRFVSSLPQNAD